MGEGARDSGRAGPRLGRGLGGRLGAHHHRPRSSAPRPPVRAFPQPRAGLYARLRHRLLRRAARRGHPPRPGEVRRPPGRPDHHLRNASRPRRAARRRTRPRNAVWQGRRHLPHGSQQPGGPGHARRSVGERTPASRRPRIGRERRPPDRHRAQARRALSPRFDPRRRRGHRRPAAGRAGAALPRPALRDTGDPVLDEGRRKSGIGQVRLPRP